MRTLFCISLIAAMFLAASSAAAGPQEERMLLSEIQVRAPVITRYYMNPAQLSEIQGTYRMDNGQGLKVRLFGNRLLATLNDRGESELVPIAENMFVSKDRDMALEYKPIAFGDEIVLSYRTDMASAQPAFTTVHLALNR